MNRATRISAITLATVFALGGLSHGIGEVLQGNTPTNGRQIDAIGPAHQTWEYGGESAITLIPNFLYTGIAAITVSLLIVVWAFVFLHRPGGPWGLLALFITLLLVGGGIGQVLFFPWAVAVATRINHPLTGWRRRLPDKVRGRLAAWWPALLSVGVVSILFALYIAVFGYVPGLTGADARLILVGILLLTGLLGFLASFVAAFAHDIEQSLVATEAQA
ncbi:MAG: hypothetical protein AAF125_12205 [Chloroflexota bacterium]